jgi:hypothetical protein
MATYIDQMLAERRTLQQAVADIRAKYRREPDGVGRFGPDEWF